MHVSCYMEYSYIYTHQAPGLSVPTGLLHKKKNGNLGNGKGRNRVASSKVVFTEYTSVSELVVEILYCFVR